MKYFLFAGERYYPGGGMEDLKGQFETLEEARGVALAVDEDGCGFEWWHIVQFVDGHLVEIEGR